MNCDFKFDLPNIAQFDSYFHDGFVLSIIHNVDEIVFGLQSVEIDPQDISEKNEKTS